MARNWMREKVRVFMQNTQTTPQDNHFSTFKYTALCFRQKQVLAIPEVAKSLLSENVQSKYRCAQARSQTFAMGGCFRGLGAEPQAGCSSPAPPLATLLVALVDSQAAFKSVIKCTVTYISYSAQLH